LAAEEVTGLILAGGEGRRMGGADKGLLDYRGRPLVAEVIERFTPQVKTLIISVNRNLDAYRAFGYPVVTDASDARLGPLAGIAAGLAVCTTPWLAVCPCDCPDLPADWVARLKAAVGRAPLAVATTSAGLQPTVQLCRRELLPRLLDYLESGERRVAGWCRVGGAVMVPFADAAAFANLNRPDDLSR